MEKAVTRGRSGRGDAVELTWRRSGPGDGDGEGDGDTEPGVENTKNGSLVAVDGVGEKKVGFGFRGGGGFL